ncbi:MAG: hypothetical protein MUC59_08425 [Saprospiraceae bacterium]|nr:hypothetical protein [Saprospiraceae bacterium]
MKNFALCLLAAMYLLVASCNNCRNTDCAVGEDLNFRFFSAADSSDLILSGTYAVDSVSIIPILIDSTNAVGKIKVEDQGGGYYHAFAEAHRNVAGYIVQLDSLPPDTLLVETATSDGEDCCAGSILITSATLNGTPIAEPWKGIYFYK